MLSESAMKPKVPGSALASDRVQRAPERTDPRDWLALQDLVQRQRSRIWNLANGTLNDSAEAERFVQGAFVSAFEQLPTLGSKAPSSSWLLKLCAQLLLKRAPLSAPVESKPLCLAPRSAQDGALEAAPGDWVERGAEADDKLLGAVAATVAGLPSEHRAACARSEPGELSCQCIAAASVTATPVVRRRLHEARLCVLVAMDTHRRAARAAA